MTILKQVLVAFIVFSKKNQLVSIYFLTSLIAVILYSFNPAEPGNIYPPSLTREWSSFYCAGCGTLRGLHHLLNGNLPEAIRYNPLLIIFLPYFLYWTAPYFLAYFYNFSAYKIKYKNIQLLTTVSIVIVYTVLRNTNYPLLSWLVPPTS